MSRQLAELIHVNGSGLQRSDASDLRALGRKMKWHRPTPRLDEEEEGRRKKEEEEGRKREEEPRPRLES